MAGTVQILGFAPNVAKVPDVPGAERWGINHPSGYRKRGAPQVLETWTRWFNLHSLGHIFATYPRHGNLNWYTSQDGSRRIYLQYPDHRIPGSVMYPRETVQACFERNGQPENFFTCSAAWLIALAILEKFQRIELWGFAARGKHESQQPGLAFWVQRARNHGIEVVVPPGVDLGEAPDNPQYTGPLYGYETT